MSDDEPIRTSSIYFTGTIDQSLAMFKDKPRWLIEGLVPAAGTVLLYGRFSLGKSPFCWAMAQSVSEGHPFFGYHVSEKGPILWLELDEPLLIANERLAKLRPRPKDMLLVGAIPFSILHPSEGDLAQLYQLNYEVQPKLVVVNTLRKIHTLDDKDSMTPSKIYGAFRRIFPDSVVLFIHHDRKQARDDKGNIVVGDEDFSGSQAWANDATLGLHMTSVGNPRHRTIEVAVTKSQVSAVGETLKLRLGDDGLTWTDMGAERIRVAFRELSADMGLMERYENVAAVCSVSTSTVRRTLASSRDCSQAK